MTDNRSSDALRADLALIQQIPLYAIPDDEPFTLDMHLALNRVIDALPELLRLLDQQTEASSERCPRCEGYEATYHTFRGECSEGNAR